MLHAAASAEQQLAPSPGTFAKGPSVIRRAARLDTRAGEDIYNRKNVDLARRLLKESGYDGRPIALVTNRDIEWLYRAAVPVQPQLEAIGFKVELVVRDWPGQIAQQKEGNFDMAT